MATPRSRRKKNQKTHPRRPQAELVALHPSPWPPPSSLLFSSLIPPAHGRQLAHQQAKTTSGASADSPLLADCRHRSSERERERERAGLPAREQGSLSSSRKKMVAECRGGGGDCLIKLFGKTIPVPEAKDLHRSGGGSSSSTESDAPPEPESAQQEQDGSDQSPQPEVVDAEDPSSKSSSPEVVAADDDAASLREKLKKPDKLLPCPRCSSMDTKFCYFNNYNVNQPRHFCKNCQRYWTAGGAMRNVPVGAGRRKNKHAVAASHFFHQRVRAADPLTTTNGGTVLSFAHDDHHHLAEEPSHRLIKARTTDAGHPSLAAAAGPCSEGSSNDSREYDDTTRKDNPADGGTVWPPYGCAPSPAAAPYFSSGIAIPIYPAAAPGYWGCMVPGPWNLPWPVAAGPGLLSSSPTSAPSSVSSSSLTLGKHPREGDDDADDGSRSAHGGANKVWAPKTIRIDDADEVARSSIWSLIRIKGDRQQEAADHAAGAGGHRLGTVFEPKKMAKQAIITASPPPLHANPVALTRSVTFQEGS